MDLIPILPISTQDYVGPNLIASNRYNFVGVTYQSEEYSGSRKDLLQQLEEGLRAEAVKLNAEVVTDVAYVIQAYAAGGVAEYVAYAYGTALIPKRKSE